MCLEVPLKTICMNAEALKYIEDGCLWKNLPESVKQIVENEEAYNKAVVENALNHQLWYKGFVVRNAFKDERNYYKAVVEHSMERLMLYPYHLQTKMVGLRYTPFSYYIQMVEKIMQDECSYDCLPNFTAADALRLLGIGRNEYIEMMNQKHVNHKHFINMFRKIPSVKDCLPKVSSNINIESWWTVHVGYVTEDDINKCSPGIKTVIDSLIDKGPSFAGNIDYNIVQELHRRGLIFFQVPIEEDDYVSVPPLEGFVMNRVSGDYLETLLYKVFVSIDEKTSVKELASVLDIPLKIAKNAVSVFCRLGFAYVKNLTKNISTTNKLHASWKHVKNNKCSSETVAMAGPSLSSVKQSPPENHRNLRVFEKQLKDLGLKSPNVGNLDVSNRSLLSCSSGKRIAFIFDSSLTAFLMMGNLSPGLKTHAVTLFEVGKLSDESIDSFLTELDKVESLEGYEGDAHRYYIHAVNLRNTIRTLRHNKVFSHLTSEDVQQTASPSLGIGIDLIQFESLNNLENNAIHRLLHKKYRLVIAMTPLAEILNIPSSSDFFFIGPPSIYISSSWFKMYLYQVIGNGPPSLFLPKGTKLCILPSIFMDFKKLLVTPSGNQSFEVNVCNVLLMLNEALINSAVLIQGFQRHGQEVCIAHVPFPVKNDQAFASPLYDRKSLKSFYSHVIIQKLCSVLGLQCTCGYISLLVSKTDEKNQKQGFMSENVELLNVNFGIPLFDEELNEDVCKLMLQLNFSRNDMLSLKNFNESLKTSVALFIRKYQKCEQSSTTSKCGEMTFKDLTEPLLFTDRYVTLWNKFNL